jgi:hypothetical protein
VGGGGTGTHSVADDVWVCDLSERSSPRNDFPQHEAERVDVRVEGVGTSHEHLGGGGEVRREGRGW